MRSRDDFIASLGNRAAGKMNRYPIQSHYHDSAHISPCPILEMLSAMLDLEMLSAMLDSDNYHFRK